ncbi:SoxR-reducing system protein RseC [Arsenophonus apicola]|uniref:SoxR-reducing system protein RseC n=1 Tax=Arsenophonus apicola TaxID=2879119 RepID=A0ABY8P577_9GAMM|nr:SoxR-reducing system protein RseC [Arsenophonus apicola]WGO84382.1 SoxR-reducing system protein RseC [Arsenophonus apicola]
MVKEWATVVRWHNGRVVLRYGSNSGCGSCAARSTCGSYILNKIGPKTEYQLELEISQPLVVGQKVEIGIPEGSLLRSAMLVYLTPLLGLFIAGGVVQFFFLNQLIIFFGAVVGASVGFFLAKKIAYYWEKETLYHPTILQIGLPPNELKEQV